MEVQAVISMLVTECNQRPSDDIVRKTGTNEKQSGANSAIYQEEDTIKRDTSQLNQNLNSN